MKLSASSPRVSLCDFHSGLKRTALDTCLTRFSLFVSAGCIILQISRESGLQQKFFHLVHRCSFPGICVHEYQYRHFKARLNLFQSAPLAREHGMNITFSLMSWAVFLRVCMRRLQSLIQPSMYHQCHHGLIYMPFHGSSTSTIAFADTVHMAQATNTWCIGQQQCWGEKHPAST